VTVLALNAGQEDEATVTAAAGRTAGLPMVAEISRHAASQPPGRAALIRPTSGKDVYGAGVSWFELRRLVRRAVPENNPPSPAPRLPFDSIRPRPRGFQSVALPSRFITRFSP